MALWSASKQNWTPVAVADTTAFTDNGYMALQGGSATQRIEVIEVSVVGLASASAASQLLFGRDSTVGASAFAGALLGPLDPATANLAAQMAAFGSSTTKPQRSSTLGALIVPSLNCFGGIYRWKVNSGAGEGIYLLGNAQPNGELSLSHASTGTPGLVNAHIIFEPT